MRSATRFGLALITTAIVALLPARAEAESYTFSKCLSTSGLCASLAPQLSAEPTKSVDGDWVETRSTTTVAEQYFDASAFLPKVNTEDSRTGITTQSTTVSGTGESPASLRMTTDVGPLFDEVTGAVRIAAHVQSDKYSLITAQVVHTPEPASMFLFGLVAFGVAYRLRRRSADTGSAS